MCLCHINYMTQYLLPNWVNTKTNILSINIYYHEAREHIHHTWHSLRVPPDCTKSSTITTWRPSGFPSFIRTILLSPSRTLLQTICTIKQTNMKSMTRKQKIGQFHDYICPSLQYKVCETRVRHIQAWKGNHRPLESVARACGTASTPHHLGRRL